MSETPIPPIPPSPLPPVAWAPPPPVEPPRRRAPVVLLAIAAVMAGLLAIGSGIGIGWGLAQTLGAARVAQQGLAVNAPGIPSTMDSVAAKVAPAVVDVNTTVESGGREGQAAGTGMILTSNGEVLTNHHVVAGATRIEVVTAGGHSYGASVIGVDTGHDVALLQLSGASHLPTVTFATSSPAVGERVIAIGNAFGQGGSPTVTQGSITGLDRSITATDGAGSSEQLDGLLEMDASISPGDSGGPLVDLSGKVVGMITAGDSGRFRQTSTDGYAVPASTARDSVSQIRSGNAGPTIIIGKAGYIGVQVQDLDADAAARLGYGVSSGVLVVGVVAGSPAAGAGIGANAVITAVNGQQVTSVDSLGSLLHPHRPGEHVDVTWVDAQGTHTASLTLTSGPAV